VVAQAGAGGGLVEDLHDLGAEAARELERTWVLSRPEFRVLG